MFKRLTLMTAMTVAVIGGMAAERNNPFLEPYNTPYNIPPFDRITTADYMPALEEGLKIYRGEIDAIANQKATPTFDNTILAMEKSGELTTRVMGVLMSLSEADSNPELQKVADEAMLLYGSTVDNVMMNDKLFERVKYLYDNRAKLGLSGPRRRAVEKSYRDFTRNGALLSAADKEELKKLNNRLTELYSKFNSNLLKATNSYQLVVDDPAMLSGLPESTIALAADEAKQRGLDGKWVFTLHAPSRLPVLQFADNRDLRRQIYEAYTTQASSGEYNNYPVIGEIVKTRAAKAKLLGYPDYAAYMTANVMAKTPENAENLLMQIWRPAIKRVDKEVAEMQTLADDLGDKITIEPWDYYYYAEKVRRKKYALDEDEVKGYFEIDSVAKGIFAMAERLYGIHFTPIPNAPKYHPDVKVYDVTDDKGEHVAVFMTDYFSRPSKRQGAWMESLQGSFIDPDGKSQRPIVYNVANFAKPTPGSPSLLSMDDVETMFHEFGHGLHGMLTRAALRSQSGTNVDRDYVELPSQIHEHWAFEPSLLKEYAHHYKTGAVIPDSLIAKIEASSTHNQGFTTTELAGAALLDLAWGHLNPAEGETVDVEAFEAQVANKLGMPRQVKYRYRSPYFKHVFGSDGYASGYYTYLWAEVLDTDGFELFREKGVFDPATAKLFRENVLEMGGSEDPMVLYVKFRGHEPSVKALLRNRGLDDEAEPESHDLKTPGGK
ncbi:MAG: M3 family metallopeptidase [Muribaculaceae bacterium]|nr:M3 family metallopeptidase [Prevotella sp.]CCX43449.1 peptidyl-dipeptidase Dcp [Prevotella sp. CAG:1031]